MQKALNSKVIVILIVLSIVSTALVLAQPWQKWLYDKKTVEKIGLSEEQVATLQSLFLETQKELEKLKAELKVQNLDLRNELRAEKPSTDKVMKLVEEAGALKTEIKKLHLQRLLKSREILEPEQQKKINKLTKKAWRKQRAKKWKEQTSRRERPAAPPKAERGLRPGKFQMHRYGKELPAPEWRREMGPRPERMGQHHGPHHLD